MAIYKQTDFLGQQGLTAKKKGVNYLQLMNERSLSFTLSININ
jgi:hypothetical protein